MQGWSDQSGLTEVPKRDYLDCDGGNRPSSKCMETKMTESKNDFRKALGSVIDARGRESSRQVSYRMQHQLIGAFTKRP